MRPTERKTLNRTSVHPSIQPTNCAHHRRLPTARLQLQQTPHCCCNTRQVAIATLVAATARRAPTTDTQPANTTPHHCTAQPRSTPPPHQQERFAGCGRKAAMQLAARSQFLQAQIAAAARLRTAKNKQPCVHCCVRRANNTTQQQPPPVLQANMAALLLFRAFFRHDNNKQTRRRPTNNLAADSGGHPQNSAAAIPLLQPHRQTNTPQPQLGVSTWLAQPASLPSNKE